MDDFAFAATREQSRKLDRIAIENFEIPPLVLMENAGRACADEAESLLKAGGSQKAVIFAGPGNNGGDGFVVARHLFNRGYEVSIYLTGDIDKALGRGNAASANLKMAMNMEIPLEERADRRGAVEAARGSGNVALVVDAMLGTGVSSEVRQPQRAAIEALNELGVRVLAVDVPSGLDCNTGRPLGVAVRAERTVTFVLNKTGFTREGASRYVGKLRVAEISVPRELIKQKISVWREET